MPHEGALFFCTVIRKFCCFHIDAELITMMIVRPSTPLVDDILHFYPKTSKRLKEHGVQCCHSLSLNKDFINHNDCRRWNKEIE